MGLLEIFQKWRERREERRKEREREIKTIVFMAAVNYIHSIPTLRKYVPVMLGYKEGTWVVINEWTIKGILSVLYSLSDDTILQLIDQLERSGCIRTDRPLIHVDPPKVFPLPPVSSEPLRLANKVKVTPVGSMVYTAIIMSASVEANDLTLPGEVVEMLRTWDRENKSALEEVKEEAELLASASPLERLAMWVAQEGKHKKESG